MRNPFIALAQAAAMAAAMFQENMLKRASAGQCSGYRRFREYRSKYQPHQGQRECARRVRQLAVNGTLKGK